MQSPIDDLISRGVAAYKAGDIVTSTTLFAQALKIDNNSEYAWGWLGGLLTDPGQKRYCFERALAANPSSTTARVRLSDLPASIPSVRPPIIDNVAEPNLHLPSSMQTKGIAQAAPIKKRGCVTVSGIALISCIIVVCIGLTTLAGHSNSVSSSSVSGTSATLSLAPTDRSGPTTVPTHTPIPTSTPLPGTQTAIAKQELQATQTALNTQYQEIDIRELVKNPEKYHDDLLRLTGKVFTIQENNGITVFQMWVPVPGGNEFDQEAVVVRFPGSLDKVYKDSQVIVYGTGAGAFEGTNAFGADIRQPMIDATYVRS